MVVAPLLALALASSPAPDSAQRPIRIARRFEEVVVRAPLHDLRSTETVHLITGEALRRLPIDRLADAIALKAGVVARGEEVALVVEGDGLLCPGARLPTLHCSSCRRSRASRPRAESRGPGQTGWLLALL